MISEGLPDATRFALLEATMESLTIDIGQGALAMELIVQELVLVAEPARGSLVEVTEVHHEVDRLPLLGCLVDQMPASTHFELLTIA